MNRKPGTPVFFLMLAICFSGFCVGTPSSDSAAAASGSFTIKSPAFQNKGEIPRKNSRSGGNQSIPLSWSNPPAGTVSFMIIMDDPDADNFLHWCIYNIPAATLSLAENASAKGIPAGAGELRNYFGSRGYGGPQPPEKHRYTVTIYALSAQLKGINEKSSLEQVMKAADGKILGKAFIQGSFTP